MWAEFSLAASVGGGGGERCPRVAGSALPIAEAKAAETHEEKQTNMGGVGVGGGVPSRVIKTLENAEVTRLVVKRV